MNYIRERLTIDPLDFDVNETHPNLTLTDSELALVIYYIRQFQVAVIASAAIPEL